MEEVIKKLKEHDKEFALISKKFDEHDKRFDAIDKKFDEHDKRFDEHDKQLEIIASTVLAHTERLDRIEDKLDGVATKKDISKVMNTLDTLVVLYKKKDQEQTFLAHNVKKVTDRVEVLEKDVRQMKPLLGLS